MREQFHTNNQSVIDVNVAVLAKENIGNHQHKGRK